ETAVYALCRPPGHHTRRDSAGGFCYINSAAFAAQELRSRFHRVLVLDTDVHHSQGTQDIFYDRDDVMTVSVHANPENFYPVVAGFADETGNGAGEGCNLNVPVPHGASEDEFFEHVDRAIEAGMRFGPEALVFAHGFVIYVADPHSPSELSAGGFGR